MNIVCITEKLISHNKPFYTYINISRTLFLKEFIIRFWVFLIYCDLKANEIRFCCRLNCIYWYFVLLKFFFLRFYMLFLTIQGKIRGMYMENVSRHFYFIADSYYYIQAKYMYMKNILVKF